MTKINGYAFSKKKPKQLCSILWPNLGQTLLITVVLFAID